MKKRVLVTFLILMMVVVPSVLAVEISVKTLPGHIVTIFLRTPGSFDVLDFHQGKAEGGVVDFVSDFSRDLVDLQVNVATSSGDNVIVVKKSGVVATGVIDLYLPSEDGARVTSSPLVEEEVVDETPEEEVVAQEVEEKPVEEEKEVEGGVVTAGLTGRAVESVKGLAGSRTTYYVLGAIVALFALLFVVRSGINRIGKNDNYKVVKYGSGINDDNRLMNAERKLEEARKELEDIKNRKRRLAEAKARLQKDKEELSQLE